MRLTLNQIATTQDALTASAVPFAIVCQPFADVPAAEGAVPVVDFGQSGPVRCNRCLAYVNAFFAFSNGGRQFTCNMCGHLNETRRDYRCEIDHTGYRGDQHDRPELCKGVIDFVAPQEYQVHETRLGAKARA